MVVFGIVLGSLCGLYAFGCMACSWQYLVCDVGSSLVRHAGFYRADLSSVFFDLC